ncbi:MAG: translation initiation factor IF-2 [Ilumatobacter sp.]|nr:translation initiation factor IF-2 [Ilumatobacter sp.]
MTTTATTTAEQLSATTLLRFATAGSVDDGKSTLVGRLLHDSKSVLTDQLEAVEAASLSRGHEGPDLALLTDGLRAEREQGITIDVAYRFFSTERRKFIVADTPGHEQYTRNMVTGASTADVAVILVDARKGVLTQTRRHSYLVSLLGIKRVVVAVNKIDKDNADPQRVLTELAEHELVPESWGGDTIVVEMSALKGQGVDEMIEQLQLVAELEELQANPEGRAKGIVIEAQLDKGRGPVATVLVDKGTLKVGDPIVAGGVWGKVRAMINDKGDQIKEAGPSTPVVVLGLSGVPEAGDEFRAAPNDKVAKTVGEARGERLKARHLREDSRVKTGTKLEDIFAQIQSGEKAQLNLLIKADVQGSLEAVTGSLRQLDRDEVELTFVHRAVGGITENDITLAEATNATIIGFNVRPDGKARKAADHAQVEIRTYEIIYKLLEDIELSMIGMLDPEYEEQVTGEAEVREIFRVPKQGAIAGCMVTSGVITRGSKVRFLRDGTIIWKGAIASLRRFKDDAREVREGFECGVGLDDFQDLKPGDIIETYEDVEVERTSL